MHMNRKERTAIGRNKRKHRRHTASLLAICLLLTAATACSKETIQPTTPPVTPTTSAQPSPIAVQTPSPTPEAFTMPLTGLPVDAPLAGRPMLVTVENSPPARPQSGLDKADIVYEVLAEGEITRFLAIYQSQRATTIGPVRSMRPYFVEIGDGLDAILVHAGWSPDAMALMTEKKTSHLDQVYGDDAFYWRSGERKAPHNLYTSTDKMMQGAAKRKFRTEWDTRKLAFAKPNAALPLDQSGTSIEIPYLLGYKVSYAYDAASGLYQRTMAGKPHVDKETGKQLTAKNILVVETRHQVLDKEGRRSVDVYGPGMGYILQDGKSQRITWERKNGLIRAFAGDREVPLLPGTTWVQIVPMGTKVTIQ